MLLPWGFGSGSGSRLGGWKVGCLEYCDGKGGHYLGFR